MAELERQLTALRQQLAEEGDRSRRLEAALEAARQDGTVVGSRLRSELAAKQEEVGAGCICSEVPCSLAGGGDGGRNCST